MIDKENTIVILSMRLAGYLMYVGNPVLALRNDLKQNDKKVFVFKKTNKLESDMKYFEIFKLKNT